MSFFRNFNSYNGENGRGVPTHVFRKALNDFVKDSNRSSNFMRLLNRIDLSPIQEQYRHYETIVGAMEATLRPLTPRQVTDKVVRIWQCLKNLIPRRLYEQTLQVWLTTSQAALSSSNILVKIFLMKNILILLQFFINYKKI